MCVQDTTQWLGLENEDDVEAWPVLHCLRTILSAITLGCRKVPKLVDAVFDSDFVSRLIESEVAPLVQQRSVFGGITKSR